MTLKNLDQRRAEFWTERPEPLTHAAFACTLTVPDSEDDRGQMQPYFLESHPGQGVILKALDGDYNLPGRRFQVFVIIGDAQGAGKSWMLQICAFRDLIECGRSVIYGLPTRDLAGDIWETKIKPAIVGSGLGTYMPIQGPGARMGGKPRLIRMRHVAGKGGGVLVFMAAGGRGQSGQASLTARKLIVDEVEDWPPTALQLIRNRVSRYNETAQQLYACTLNKNNNPYLEDDDSRIQPLYDRSTKGRLSYVCPHCGDRTRFEMAGFKYEGATKAEFIESARIHCTKCGAGLSDAERRASFATALPEFDNPDAASWGLLLNAWDCPWKSLAWLAEKHHNASLDLDRGSHDAMRQFYNKEASIQYLGDLHDSGNAERLTPAGLLRRSQASTWGPSEHHSDRAEDQKPSHSRHIAPLPEGAEWLFGSVDIQANRCYWLLMAGDSSGRTWDVGFGYEHFDSNQEEMNPQQLWSVLDRISGVFEENRGSLPIIYRGVDSNFNTDNVHSWLKLHPEWMPLYGASAQKASKMAHKSGDAVGDYPGILFLRKPKGWTLRQPATHIDTNPMRMLAQRALLLQPGEPGAAHLPNGLKNTASDRAYLQHLCAEYWDESKMKWEKVPGGGRNDWLDCRVYATALHRYHLAKLNKPKAPARKYGNIGAVRT